MNRDNTRIILRLLKENKIGEKEALEMIFDNEKLAQHIISKRDNGDME